MTMILRRAEGTLSCTFTDPDTDLPADPTTVTLSILRPDGVTDTYTYAAAQLTKVSTGVYEKSYTFNLTGRYDINWVTGTPVIVVYDFVDVPVTPFDA